MADNTIKSDVFKFVALRPPVSIERKNQEANFIADNRQADETPVGRLTKTFDKKDGTKIPDQIKSFIAENNYDLNYPESEENFTLSKIYDFVLAITKDDYNSESLQSDISNILDNEIPNYLKKNENKNLVDNIWDRYYAFYILARTENQNLESLTKNLRVLHLLQFVNTFKINNYETLQRVILAKPIVSKLFADLPKALNKVEIPKKEEPKPETIREYKKIWSDLVDTHRAIEEVKNIKFDTKLSTETKNVTSPNKCTGIEEKSKLTFVKNNLSVNKKSFENLHSNTKSILNTFNLTDNNFQITKPIPLLQNKLENLFHIASNINDVEFIKHMPVEAKLIPGITSIVGGFGDWLKPIPFTPPTNIRSSIKPLGVGDLKVVKQTLKKYVAGEVAHIENVLRGEYKERKHRVLDRTEDIFTISSESDEETTKDTQTTERFELKKESEKTVQEQMSVQAGVTVSGSYGMVTFGAHGDFAYSTSSQESNKSSSNFAREVIDKSVSKIQKKTKEERSTKKLHEVEEINTHGIDNKDKPDHVTGIYRWVDKYYEAQIYNYGKRMMFEFIIPEPAAFYEYAQTHKPKKDVIAPIVPYRWIQDSKGNWIADGIITHKDISEWNYQLLIRDYNVQGISVPPPPMRIASLALEQSGIESGLTATKSSKELVVPEGYGAKYLGLNMSAIWENYPQFKIAIGEMIIDWLQTSIAKRAAVWGDTTKGFPGYDDQGVVPISINSYDVNSYAVNVLLICERTAAKYEQWQIQTYEKIMAAYKALQIEYEQKLAAHDTMQDIAIQGQNPFINRDIEKTELKKQCVKMLMDTFVFGSFDAMKDNAPNPPEFDIFDAMEEGKTIQFFEQAFEWENLTYLFYPYFWARKNQWVHKSNIYDTDPLFTKFLQAGSSRVVIPVLPAYNDAVMYFLENNGAIWKGGEPPLLNDPMFISIADELRNQTDDLANASAEGEPWEVVLPTTLVYLQKDSDLPTFK